MIRPRYLTRQSASRSLPSQACRPLRRQNVRDQNAARRQHRAGLTLLEILLASAILAAALSVLAQQNATGVQAALRSQLESEAAMRCQSLLNQLLAEGLPETDVEDRPISQDSRWRWSARSAPSQFRGLRLLTVTVYQDGANQRISSQSLSRLVPNSQREIRP